MKNNKWIYLIYVILVVGNCGLIYRIIQCSKSEIIQRAIVEKKTLREQELIKGMFNNMEIEKYISNIIESSLDRDYLKEDRLILSFTNSCKQCTYKAIMDLNVLADEIGIEKILLLGFFESEELLEDYLYHINDKLEYVNCNALIDDFILKDPVLFIIKPNMDIQNVFVLNDKYSTLQDYYINNVIKKDLK